MISTPSCRARRKLPGAVPTGMEQAKPCEIRQFQRAGVRLRPAFGDMPKRVGTHVAKLVSVSGRTNAKRIENCNDCSAHARTLAEP